MRTRRWLTWLVFAVCAMAVIEGLGWVTWQALRLERREREARAQAQFQESIRLALWRMESELTPVIAQEAARPYFHYLSSFYPAERAYTRMWQEVQPNEVLVPSPLLDSATQYVRLYFQIAPDGQITSPQAPTGNMRDLAESQYVDSEFIVLAGYMLDQVAAMVRASPLDAQQAQGPAPDAPFADRASAAQEQVLAFGQYDKAPQQTFSTKEYEARKQAAQVASSANDVRNRGKTQILGDLLAQQREEGQTAAALPPTSTSRSPAPAAPTAAPTQTASAPTGGRSAGATALAAEAKKELESRSTPAASTGIIQPERADEPKDALRDDKARSPLLKNIQGPGYSQTHIDVEQGPLEPLWRDNPINGNHELLFRRTVEIQGRRTIQGFWMDWPALRTRLLEVGGDLLPGSTLAPVLENATDEAAPSARRLATIPVLLNPGPVPAIAAQVATPTHITLGFTWLAVLGAIIAIGIVLRTAMELGDRRGRFVSAVTHELRTPLTTFCLYTEMLADGMVAEEPDRREYLGTLKSESKRLAGIVENVLDYARLGNARRTNGHPSVPASELFARIRPGLEMRAAQAGMTLLVEESNLAGSAVRIDIPTFERILLNLVDNACKYAAAGVDRRLHVSARTIPGRKPVLEVRVRDHGPGIPDRDRRRVFHAFHRARRDADGPQSGLGLGLALARGLARGLGGELTLVKDLTDGAEFRLTVPASPLG